jgi:hypothetical protein
MQAFNLLSFAGMTISLFVAAISLVQKMPEVALVCVAAFIFAFILIRVTGKKISCRAGSWIGIIAVFFIAFPVIFFFSGGYKSGMPCYFLFALIFTTILLDKRERSAALLAEFALYTCCCLAAYFFPGLV